MQNLGEMQKFEKKRQAQFTGFKNELPPKLPTTVTLRSQGRQSCSVRAWRHMHENINSLISSAGRGGLEQSNPLTNWP